MNRDHPTPPRLVTALAGFARAVSTAYGDLADDLDGLTSPDAEKVFPVRAPRGDQQRRILALPPLATAAGLTTAQISSQAGGASYDATSSQLKSLTDRGLVEAILSRSPRRWRLGADYQAPGGWVLHVAGQVGDAEWTTAADIAAAAQRGTGAPSAASVRLAAQAVSGFPHPERVLGSGGHLDPAAVDPLGRTPAQRQELLEATGLTVVNDMADPQGYVDADELRRRAMNAAPVPHGR